MSAPIPPPTSPPVKPPGRLAVWAFLIAGLGLLVGAVFGLVDHFDRPVLPAPTAATVTEFITPPVMTTTVTATELVSVPDSLFGITRSPR